MGRQVRICSGAVAVALFGFVLAACGTNQSSTVAASAPGIATATCGPSRAFISVTGTVRSLSADALTIAGSNGTTNVVTLTSTTHLTKIVDVASASLVSGTHVQVTTDPAVTTAQRIVILSQNQGSFGGRGGSAGTPPAGVNALCFRNRGQNQGQSQGQGQGSSQGLRGTVDSATSTKLVVDDAQGQTFAVAIGPSTVIVSTATAQPNALTTGATVTVMATGSGTTVTARTITIQPAQ